LAVFTAARLFFEPRNSFAKFSLHKGVYEMNVNIVLVGNFLIAIGLLLVFLLQSENGGIL
jgi:hypothetical protein